MSCVVASRSDIVAATNRALARQKRRQEAVEEIERNRAVLQRNLAVRELEDDGAELHALEVFGPKAKAKKPRRSRRPNYQSAPDAKPMPHSDIANVEALRPEDALKLLKALVAVCGPVSQPSEPRRINWPDDDIRWTLTPHELQKLSRGRSQ